MVDAVNLQQLDRLAHIRRRPLFAGMHGDAKATLAAGMEVTGEARRRVADFGTTQTEPSDLLRPRHDRVQQLKRLGLAAMTLRTDQQTGADAIILCRVSHGSQHAMHHRLDRDAALGEALRPNKDLGTNHGVSVRAAQIRSRDVVEVALLRQDTAAFVVEVQECLQVAGTDRRRGVPPGSPTEAANHCAPRSPATLGLDAAFQVHMQFGLGHRADECVG